MRNQLVAGVMVDDDDVKQVFRQARLFANFLKTQRAAGTNLGMFQDIAIACHQVCRQNANRLVKGEVPRLDRIDHANRLIGHHAVFLAIHQLAGLVLELFRARTGGPVEDRGAEVNFVKAVLIELTNLAGHQLGQFLFIIAQLFGNLFQIGRALIMGELAPVLKGLMRGLDRAERLGF